MRILTISICSLFLFFSAQGQGIEFFEGTWEETLAKAKEEEKLIFVDAYTTWCGPCKRMAKDVFTQEKVGTIYNQKFINAKMDMEAEKNMSFIRDYPVSAYPTLFFIDGNGKVVVKKVGGQQVDGLLALAKEAEAKDDRSVNFVEEYESGKRDYSFVLGYIKALNKVGKPSLKISNDYLKSNPSISEEEMNAFILEAAVEADSKIFDRLIENKKPLEKTFGKELVQKHVKRAANNTIKKGIEFEIKELVDEAVEKFGKFHSKKETKAFKIQGNMAFYRGTGKMNLYFDESNEYFKKFAQKDNEKLGMMISSLKEYRSNAKALNLLVDISGQMVKNEDNWTNLVTYAQILALNNNNQEAIEVANKAMEKSSNEKEKRVVKGILSRVNGKV